MRTTIHMDEKELKKLMALTGSKTKSDAIREAVSAYIHRKGIEELLAARGTIDIDDTWKELRELEKQKFKELHEQN